MNIKTEKKAHKLVINAIPAFIKLSAIIRS
jgi:hypothetical protein